MVLGGCYNSFVSKIETGFSKHGFLGNLVVQWKEFARVIKSSQQIFL